MESNCKKTIRVADCRYPAWNSCGESRAVAVNRFPRGFCPEYVNTCRQSRRPRPCPPVWNAPVMCLDSESWPPRPCPPKPYPPRPCPPRPCPPRPCPPHPYPPRPWPPRPYPPRPYPPGPWPPRPYPPRPWPPGPGPRPWPPGPGPRPWPPRPVFQPGTWPGGPGPVILDIDDFADSGREERGEFDDIDDWHGSESNSWWHEWFIRYCGGGDAEADSHGMGAYWSGYASTGQHLTSENCFRIKFDHEKKSSALDFSLAEDKSQVTVHKSGNYRIGISIMVPGVNVEGNSFFVEANDRTISSTKIYVNSATTDSKEYSAEAVEYLHAGTVLSLCSAYDYAAGAPGDGAVMASLNIFRVR